MKCSQRQTLPSTGATEIIIINPTKTQHMIFTLQLNVSLSHPITINADVIEQTKTAKLLGVMLDDHLSFSNHVTWVISKSRGAVHSLLTLRRHGVHQDLLVKFYNACVKLILLYGAPAWYPYIHQNSKDKLERHQSLCMRLIYPAVESYTARLSLADTPRLNDTLSCACMSYASSVAAKPDHRLYSLIPHKQTTN